MFSVWSVLTNSGTGFSVQLAWRLYNATLVIFGILQFSSQLVLGGRQPWKVHSWRRSDCVIRSDRFQLSDGDQKFTMRSDS
jgi:hypothetical protein